MTIVTFKSISGDEYIGRLVENTTEENELGIIKVSKPHVIILQERGVALMPALIASKSTDIQFFLHSLSTPPMPVKPEFETPYMEQTSGLVLSPR